MDVHVQEEFRPLVPERWLRGLVESALEVLDEDGASLLIADDEVVADLNGAHRGVREATDVLSFSFEHWGRTTARERRRSSGRTILSCPRV